MAQPTERGRGGPSGRLGRWLVRSSSPGADGIDERLHVVEMSGTTVLTNRPLTPASVLPTPRPARSLRSFVLVEALPPMRALGFEVRPPGILVSGRVGWVSHETGRLLRDLEVAVKLEA